LSSISDILHRVQKTANFQKKIPISAAKKSAQVFPFFFRILEEPQRVRFYARSKIMPKFCHFKAKSPLLREMCWQSLVFHEELNGFSRLEVGEASSAFQSSLRF